MQKDDHLLPVILSYDNSHSNIPNLQINGYNKSIDSDFSKNKKKIQLALRDSLLDLNSHSDVIIAEGSGGIADAMEYDIFHSYTAELLDFQVDLISNFEIGCSYSSIIGSIEIMDPKLRSRVNSIIINQ